MLNALLSDKGMNRYTKQECHDHYSYALKLHNTNPLISALRHTAPRDNVMTKMRILLTLYAEPFPSKHPPLPDGSLL